MKQSFFSVTIPALLLLALFSSKQVIAQTLTIQNFSYTGATQTFVPPPCVTTLTIDLKGAPGGPGNLLQGGSGGGATVVIGVTPGQPIYINVGGQGNGSNGGFNGGGNGGVGSSSTGGGGGGASDIRIGGTALANRVAVAGGGGGLGGDPNGIPYGGDAAFGFACTNPTGVAIGGGGGFGGGLPVAGVCAGGTATAYGAGGGGGGLTSGGGVTGSGNGGFGGAGGLGFGGGGGDFAGTYGGSGGINGGGGGGGGYYGGAGGMAGGIVFIGQVQNGGGGGGSSYVDPNVCTSYVFGGMWVLDGYVKISYTNPSYSSSTTVCSGSNVTLSAGGAATYTWQAAGTFTGSSSSSVTVAPTVNTDYTVTGTSASGCISQTVITVNVISSLPVITVTAAPTGSICLGNTMQLTASGANTYTWTGGISNGVVFTPTGPATYTVTGQNACGSSQVVQSIQVNPLVITPIASSPSLCAGATITLSASSAINNYTWQPLGLPGQSITVTPGANIVYTVSASNATCAGGSATLAITVQQVPTITVASSATSVCQGGSITFSATGGLSYTWMPGSLSGSLVTVSPAAPAIYTATGVNASGCPASASQALIVNALPSLTLVASNTLACQGGSLALQASGATTYSWSTGAQTPSVLITPAVTGVYTVTGTDAITSCSTTQTVSIAVYNPQLTVSPSTVICQGASASFSASGGNAGTYVWIGTGANTASLTVSPAINTTYTVSAYSTSVGLNCVMEATVQVAVTPPPSLTLSAAQSTICKGEAVNLSVSGASGYTWSAPANAAFANTATVSVTPSVSTVYSVSGMASNCSATTSLQIIVSACTGFSEISFMAVEDLLIYPNPNQGEFSIQSGINLQLRLVNELGQEVKRLYLDERNARKAVLNGLPAGIYFVVAQSAGFTASRKMVIEK